MSFDLISRSALLEEISKCTIIPDDLYSMGIMAGVDAIKKKVENAPAVDAVEVVKCRDCKYRDPENHHCDHGTGTMIYFPRKPDDFCSYGERRADDGKL